MSTLQEFFSQPGKDGKAKGIVQKNNILKRNIIAHMAIEGECTLADLARELHVSIPTVTKLVDELLADKIIADRGKIETSGGRRPNVFGLTHSSIYFAGIEISRDQMVLMLTDLHNNVIKLEHNQFVSTNRNAAVELRITMEAFGTEHKKEILDALEEAGFRPKLVTASL